MKRRNTPTVSTKKKDKFCRERSHTHTAAKCAWEVTLATSGTILFDRFVRERTALWKWSIRGFSRPLRLKHTLRTGQRRYCNVRDTANGWMHLTFWRIITFSTRSNDAMPFARARRTHMLERATNFGVFFSSWFRSTDAEVKLCS